MTATTVYPTVDVMGRQVTLNLWGKANLLLSLLYVQGALPDSHIAGAEDSDEYFINGQPVGTTEEEVTTNIWLMVERWQKHGYMFD